MSFARSLGLSLFVVLSVGCHRHRHAKGAEVVVTESAGPLPPVAEAAPVDNRNAGQVVVDIITQLGYKCNVEETRWTCTSPNDPTWPFTVSFLVEETQTSIWLDSYQLRAFGHRCDEYTNHMADLAVPADSFVVSCDDTSQAFRMNTSVLYTSDLDVKAWLQNHLDHRATSLVLLKKAHAIRK